MGQPTLAAGINYIADRMLRLHRHFPTQQNRGGDIAGGEGSSTPLLAEARLRRRPCLKNQFRNAGVRRRFIKNLHANILSISLIFRMVASGLIRRTFKGDACTLL